MATRAALATIARDGLIVRRDVATAGIPLASFDRWVRDGELRRWDNEVYASSTLPATRRRSILAAVLACGEVACASHITAAELHACFGIARRPDVHVTLPYDEVRCPSTAVVHRSRHLEDEDVTTVGHIRVTTVTRTICDIAPQLSVVHLEQVVMDAIRRRLTTGEQLAETLHRLGRTRAGSRKLRRLLTTLHPDAAQLRSHLEVTAYPVVRATGLPGLRIGYPIVDANGLALVEIDFAFPEVKLAIEIDGLTWHATRRQKEHDDRRQNWLVERGWTVLRFSLGDLRERPDWVVGRILAVHRRLSAEREG